MLLPGSRTMPRARGVRRGGGAGLSHRSRWDSTPFSERGRRFESVRLLRRDDSLLAGCSTPFTSAGVMRGDPFCGAPGASQKPGACQLVFASRGGPMAPIRRSPLRSARSFVLQVVGPRHARELASMNLLFEPWAMRRKLRWRSDFPSVFSRLASKHPPLQSCSGDAL